MSDEKTKDEAEPSALTGSGGVAFNYALTVDDIEKRAGGVAYNYAVPASAPVEVAPLESAETAKTE